MENRGPMSEDPAGLAATTQCQRCKHFKGYSAAANDAACDAFPWGIPDKFMNDEKPHIKKDWKQEGGIIYEISNRWRDLLKNDKHKKYLLKHNMADRRMKDELTAKMHSEFTISRETEIKLKVFSLLTLTGTEDMVKIKKWLNDFGVTMTDIEKHITEFKGFKN
jgi:hypothetical protein